jgi:hypothetical protein
MVYMIFMIFLSYFMASPKEALSYLKILIQHIINIKIITPKAPNSTLP